MLCDYLSQHAVTHKPSTLTRWLASISQAHLNQGLESPCRSIEVRRTLRGIKRAHGAKPRRVSPALRDEVLAMVKAQRQTVLLDYATGDCCWLGFAGALRRSELAKLRVEDISYECAALVWPSARRRPIRAVSTMRSRFLSPKAMPCPVKAL